MLNLHRHLPLTLKFEDTSDHDLLDSLNTDGSTLPDTYLDELRARRYLPSLST